MMECVEKDDEIMSTHNSIEQSNPYNNNSSSISNSNSCNDIGKYAEINSEYTSKQKTDEIAVNQSSEYINQNMNITTNNNHDKNNNSNTTHNSNTHNNNNNNADNFAKRKLSSGKRSYSVDSVWVEGLRQNEPTIALRNGITNTHNNNHNNDNSSHNNNNYDNNNNNGIQTNNQSNNDSSSNIINQYQYQGNYNSQDPTTYSSSSSSFISSLEGGVSSMSRGHYCDSNDNDNDISSSSMNNGNNSNNINSSNNSNNSYYGNRDIYNRDTHNIGTMNMPKIGKTRDIMNIPKVLPQKNNGE